MRAFIAIPLPKELKERIYSSIKDLSIGGVKFVEKENYHLTLLFLGYIDEVEDIKIALNSINREKRELRIINTGFFPKQRPRVVWLGVNNVEYLQKLHEEVVKTTGIMSDKPFKPHITIARIRDYSIDSANLIVERIKNLINQSFIADRIVLYQSILTKKGPIYKEVYVKELE